MKTGVVIVSKVFPLYRKAVFDSMSQQVELRVLHGKNNSGIESASAPYAEEIPYIQYGKNETNVLLFPMVKILKYKPRVVIFDLALGILNLPFIILFCKLLGIKFVFWSHGYNRKKGFQPRKKIVDRYRLFLLRAADANILYSSHDKKFLQQFLDEKKIFVAQNTLDTPTLLKLRNKLEIEGKANVKKRLGITHEYNIIFISRMLSSKKPELLIAIYEILKSTYQIKVGVHFIGDGEMLPQIKEAVNLKSYNEDYYFHGAIHDDLLNGELLYSSDIMVMPGYLGLSVNYSFCFDCPVISFKEKNGYPAHSPEVEYVVDNKTGFLVEEQTPEAMAYAINSLFKDQKMQEQFTKNIRRAVETEFPLEKMVHGALKCINSV